MDGIVMRVYGIGPDDGEKEGKECPHCHKTDTDFFEYSDDARNIETHFCNGCGSYFYVDVDIPF